MPAAGHATRLWQLDSPTFTYDHSLLVANTLGEITAPIGSYLIEHERGLVLFDTNLDPDAVDDPEGQYGPVATSFGLDFPREKAIDQQVMACGFQPEDVDWLVLSHIHFDHTGGISRFPNAQVVFGEKEMAFAAWPTGANEGFFRDKDLKALREKSRPFLEVPVGIDFDLFDDGSITMLSTPGHTLGHFSLVVRLPRGNYVLAADATHGREALEREIICPSDVDTVSAVRSMKRLKLVRATLEAKVLIAHDPQDRIDFPVAPEPIGPS